MRLDRYLSNMQEGTRSEVKKIIKNGRVAVDGVTITAADYQVSEDRVVTVDGERVFYSEFAYVLLNKPQGYLCTTDGSPNVLELIENRRRKLMPVGRLDRDTEGLLLLTDDGQLAHKLISPKNHVDKVYYVETDISIPPNAEDVFEKGIEFADFTSESASFERKSDNTGYLTIHEGKYHQVKRMFAHLGCNVTFLKRVRFSFLTLEGTDTGGWRYLNDNEIKKLKAEN